MRTLLNILTVCGLLYLSSCCKTDDPEPKPPVPVPPEPEPVPEVAIVIKTGIQSRTILDAFDSTKVCIAKGRLAGEYEEIWEGLALGGEIRFFPERFYPADSSAVYLTGYYPVAPMADGAVSFTLDGQTDVMAAKVQSGSLTSTFESKTELFSFRHQLALLNFSVLLDDNYTETLSLKYLGLNGSSRQVTLDLRNGGLEFGAECPPLVVYETGSSTTGVPITAESGFSGNLLVQPQTKLTVDLILSRDENPEHDLVYEALPVHFDGSGSEANLAYRIEISLGGSDFPILPIEPDEPDNPDIPEEPDNPDEPDEPDEPVYPPETPDPKPDPNPIVIVLSARVANWNEVIGGDLDFIPSVKNNN